MKYPRNARIFRGQLDAAPFVGVFFLLAIFLILQSSLVFIPGVKVELPEAAAMGGTTNPTVVVAVDRNGLVYYGNQVIDDVKLKGELTDLVKKYHALNASLTLVIQADKFVAYDAMVRLGQLAREAGIKEILQATRPPLAPTAPEAPKRTVTPEAK
jgi:biopolymer transport protein ExbD